MSEILTWSALSIVGVGFFVGVVVGLTGMGGGALMTPALILLGFADASAVVTADLTAAAVYKTGGAVVHSKHGQPNLKLAAWLISGSVPMAFLGPFFFHAVAGEGENLQNDLKVAIGIALLFAASTYALRLYLQLRRVQRGGMTHTENPTVRPVPTLLVGALGGLLVGITSVGSGSVIMIALLMLYPGLSALRLVGTDLVQAVPLVLSAAISNIIVNHGVEWGLLVPLVIGSLPGSMLGSRIAPRVPQSWIRRGIIVVLVMSGLALLDKAGHGPQELFRAIGLSGIADSAQFPLFYLLVGAVLLVVIPMVWRKLREHEGLTSQGHPTVTELEDEEGVGHN
ncbi:MAG: sulfite exporter TauE/SafE family protein [Nocardioidaceae bacterium]